MRNTLLLLTIMTVTTQAFAVRDVEQIRINDYLIMVEISDIPAHTASQLKLYAQDASGATELFVKDEAGNEIQLTSAGAINAGSAAHNSLSSLQGGTSAEYYHLTSAQHGYLNDANAQLEALQTDGSPTFAGLDSAGDITIVGTDNGNNLLVSDITPNNSSTVQMRFAAPHYTTTEEPAAMVFGEISAANTYVNLGGGTGTLNAATVVRFYTAANNTTLTGTERMRVDTSGYVGINDTSPDYTLDVGGNIGTDGNITMTTASKKITQPENASGVGPIVFDLAIVETADSAESDMGDNGVWTTTCSGGNVYPRFMTASYPSQLMGGTFVIDDIFLVGNTSAAGVYINLVRIYKRKISDGTDGFILEYSTEIGNGTSGEFNVDVSGADYTCSTTTYFEALNLQVNCTGTGTIGLYGLRVSGHLE